MENSILCSGETVTLQATGANTYTWNTGALTKHIEDAPQSTSTYSVSGMNLLGCVGSTSYIQLVDPCMSLGEKTMMGSSVLLYPNPATVSFNLETFTRKDVFIAQLFSLDGRLILSKPINSPLTKFNIAHLANGVYILRIEGTWFAERIIKE